MKILPIFILTLCLAVNTVLPASAQPALPQGSLDHPCDQTLSAADPQPADTHVILATINGIDRQQGMLALDTQDGRFLMAVAPSEIMHLQEGDVL
jgi:hypothetical protein